MKRLTVFLLTLSLSIPSFGQGLATRVPLDTNLGTATRIDTGSLPSAAPIPSSTLISSYQTNLNSNVQNYDSGRTQAYNTTMSNERVLQHLTATSCSGNCGEAPGGVPEAGIEVSPDLGESYSGSAGSWGSGPSVHVTNSNPSSDNSAAEAEAYRDYQSAVSARDYAKSNYDSAKGRYDSAVRDNGQAASNLQNSINDLSRQQGRLDSAYSDLNQASQTYNSARDEYMRAHQSLYEAKVTLNNLSDDYKRQSTRKEQLQSGLKQTQEQVGQKVSQAQGQSPKIAAQSKSEAANRAQARRTMQDGVDKHNRAAMSVNDASNLQNGADSIQDFLAKANQEGTGGDSVDGDPAPGYLPVANGDAGYVSPSRSEGGLPSGMGSQPVEQPAVRCGSIIHVDSLTLGESIPLPGTSVALYYFSDRVPGRRADYQLDLPASQVPLTVNIAGRENSIPAASLKQGYALAWDGLNKNGVAPIAQAPVKITAGQSTFTRFLGNYKPAYQGFGGWSAGPIHYYSVAEGRIYFGYGGSRAVPGAKAEGGFYRLPSDDGSTIFTFTAEGLHIETRHGLTGALLYTIGYDENGRVSEITDSYQNQTLFSRTGGRIQVRGPYGRTFTLELDSDGYLTSVSNPQNETYRMTYIGGGLITSFQKPAGQTSRFTYDSLGYLQKDEGAGGDSSTFTGSVNGKGAGIMDLILATAEGRQTRFTLKRLEDGTYRRETVEANGARSFSELKTAEFHRAQSRQTETRTQFAPDARFGNLVNRPAQIETSTPGLAAQKVTVQQELDGKGDGYAFETLTTRLTRNARTAVTTYNSATRESVSTSPAGFRSVVITDPWGKPVRTQQGSLAPVENTYDAKGRLTATAWENRRTEYFYGSNGELESIRNSAGDVTRYRYDEAGRVTQQIFPDGREIHFKYDQNGNIVSIAPPGRSSHTFGFNLMELIERYLAPLFNGGENARETTYSYNRDKQITEIGLPGGEKIAYVYGRDGSLQSRTTSQGAYEFSYKEGILNSVSAPSGVKTIFDMLGDLPRAQTQKFADGVSSQISFSYDGDLQVSALAIGDSTVAFAYDADGLPVRAGDQVMTWSHDTNSLTRLTLEGVQENYGYDSTYGEKNSLMAGFRGQMYFGESLARDNMGRVVSRRERYGRGHSLFNYFYDNSGRLVSVTQNGSVISEYSYDSNGNRVSAHTGGKRAEAAYDAQDRLVKYGGTTFSYDRNGRLAGKQSDDGKTSYSYDGVGNLLGVKLPSGKLIQYQTDGLDRRVTRFVDGQLKERYVYQSPLAIAAVLDARGGLVSRFVYATKANVPDYMIKGGRTYKIVSDHLGSPRLVIDTASGQIAQTLVYDEFGRVLRDTNPGFQPFGFAGGLYDGDTRLVRFGARDYDAETGRWTAKDPLLFDGGDSNLYGYVLNDPTNLTDPTGNCPWCVGAAVGGIASGISAYMAGGDARTIAISAGIGAIAGAASMGVSALTTTAAGIAATNAAIGATANVATQVATGTSLGNLNIPAVVIGGVAGGAGGLLGLGAGTTAFSRTPVLGNPLGNALARSREFWTALLVGATSGTALEISGGKLCK